MLDYSTAAVRWLASLTLLSACALCAADDSSSHTAAPQDRFAVTYTRDIAPILNKNCVVCHRAGQVAPFALDSYAQAIHWAHQIKQVTTGRRMPPWGAVRGYGDFHDCRRLTNEQIVSLAKWADSGAHEGCATDLPPAPHFPPPAEWQLGKPDVILQPDRPFHVDADGKDVYRNFVLPIDFKQDRYLSGMEFKPGNRAAVHHIIAYIDPTGRSAAMEGKDGEPGYSVSDTGIGINEAQWADVWVAGSGARALPPGTAIRIPAGSKLVMQVHYHKTGKPEVDTSQAALYFATGTIENAVYTIGVGSIGFSLRPGSNREEIHASWRAPADMHVRTIFPHMHMLGREMKVTATLPDGTVEPLVWVNDWDFNWQMTYVYNQPVALPRGTRIDLIAVYDNSEQNPRQPSHPPKPVGFGGQTTDEMCFAFLGYTVDGEHLGVQIPAAARTAESR